MDATWSPLINNVIVFPFMCDLVILNLEISNMPEATSGCSGVLAAAKYYCMKNAAAAVEEEEDTPPPPPYSKTQVADKKCIFPLQNLLSDL